MASYPTPTQPLLPLLWPFPIRGRLILFSFSMIFSLKLLLSLYEPISFMSLCMTSLHLRFGFPIFRFHLLPFSHLLSFHLHVLTISVSASRIFSLMFATPALAITSSVFIFSILFIPVIHLNMLISVISSKSYSPIQCQLN